MVKDFAQAAWNIVAGILAKQGSVTLQSVSVRPEKTALLKHFILMNVALRMDNHRWIDNEPVADFCITPPKTLFPVRVREEELPDLLETLPILLIATACADGTSIIPYHAELISLVDALTHLGVNITLETGVYKIVGQPGLKAIVGAQHVAPKCLTTGNL